MRILVVILFAIASTGMSQEAETIQAPSFMPDDSFALLPGDEQSRLTLSTVEELAVAASPSLQALQSRLRAARWQCVQAGLMPNPTVGYVANEIGNEGSAGQQGMYFGQRFVTGGKLSYAQAVAAKEANRLEQMLAAERLRVLTDVRTGFFEVYLAELERNLTDTLIELSNKASQTSEQLVQAGEGRRTDSLQAQIEYQRAIAARRQAVTRRDASWRRLATLTGLDPSAPQLVSAEVSQILRHVDWDASVETLIITSPEIAARVAAIEKARCEVARQRAAVIPDISAQLTVQYDDSTEDTFTGVQLGIPLPLWNRNQGGVGQACAALAATRRELEATEQALTRRLATTFGEYETAMNQAIALKTEVLPRATESLELATSSYDAGEIDYLSLLTVQRTYFQVNLEYLLALRELNRTTQLITGCLLSGSGPVSP